MKKKETYLYVILLPHMDKDYNLSYKVKFGFAENFDRRMKAGYGAYYGKEGYQILHVYKGDFTKDRDEFAIKQYLKDYCLFGNEWFKCCQEVLGFFNTYDTSEKLKQKISEIPIKKFEVKYHKVNYMLLDYIIQTYHNFEEVLQTQSKRNELKIILREYTERNQYNYLKEEYGFVLDEFLQYQEIRLKTCSDDMIKKKVEEFNGIKSVKDKLKFLVNYASSTEKRNFDNFLELIPGKYKDYYQIVGPEIITACSYAESEIKKRWRHTVSNGEIQDDVVSEIYKTFEVGKRYSKKSIKDTLNDLYQRLGYQKKAKATDLELYYLMKSVYLTADKQNGFELIGKR